MEMDKIEYTIESKSCFLLICISIPRLPTTTMCIMNLTIKIIHIKTYNKKFDVFCMHHIDVPKVSKRTWFEIMNEN